MHKRKSISKIMFSLACVGKIAK